jgi:hypothetical protein
MTAREENVRWTFLAKERAGAAGISRIDGHEQSIINKE